MVGGEEASNAEVKERHQLKKEHVEERKRKLQGEIRADNRVGEINGINRIELRKLSQICEITVIWWLKR